MSSDLPNDIKKTLWTICNITDEIIMSTVFEEFSNNLFTIIMELSLNSENLDVKKESLWVICNFINSAANNDVNKSKLKIIYNQSTTENSHAYINDG